MPQPPASEFRISLKALLVAILVGGAAMGLMGRLMLRNPEIFQFVLSLGSTLLPFLCAVATVIWLGFKQRRRVLILWGFLLLLTPAFGMIGLAVFSRYAGHGAGGLGMLSTARIIRQELPTQVDQPWVWRELEQRIASGSMTQPEVGDAVGTLVKHMTQTKPGGWDQPLHWQADFVAAAGRAGLLSDQSAFDLCDAFFGTKPSIVHPERQREGATGFSIEVKYGNTWGSHSNLPLMLIWDVKQVLVDGQPIQVRRTSQTDYEWSGYHGGALPPGEHELTVEVEAAYVDPSKLLGFGPQDRTLATWPKTRKRWRKTIKAPLEVIPKNKARLKLVTDRSQRPTMGPRIQRLVIQPSSKQGKKLVVKCVHATDPMAAPTSFDITAFLGEEEISLEGGLWQVNSENSSRSGGAQFEAKLDDLDPAINTATILLTPNPKHIEHRPEVTEIWGKPIRFDNVPLERLDLEAGDETQAE